MEKQIPYLELHVIHSILKMCLQNVAVSQRDV